MVRDMHSYLKENSEVSQRSTTASSVKPNVSSKNKKTYAVSNNNTNSNHPDSKRVNFRDLEEPREVYTPTQQSHRDMRDHSSELR